MEIAPAASPEPPSAAPTGDALSGCPFADFFRVLPHGPAPAETLDAFWCALRARMREELRRRRLWALPPRFVGVDTPGDRFSADALDELTSDGFVHLMERARTLRRHAELKDRLDGLIRLEIRHFLHERQRRADPLGHRLYGMWTEAVRSALEGGDLVELPAGPDGAPLLGPASGGACEPATAEQIEDLTRRWADELLPDLVTGWGKRRARMVKALARRCGRMAQDGVSAASSEHLLRGLSRAVRIRWREVLAADVDAAGAGTAVCPSRDQWPGRSFEQRESFRALVECVTEALGSGGGLGRRRREHLMRLWRFLRLRAGDPALEDMPSRRRVAEVLGIPRSLLPDLFARLGGAVERCRGTSSPGGTT